MADEKNSSGTDVTDEELDKIIEDIAKEEIVAKPAAPTTLSAAPSPKKKKSESDQVLTMELAGIVNLKLCFSSGERSIELFCTEEALLCRMADGTEFRIPTGIVSRKRDAA